MIVPASRRSSASAASRPPIAAIRPVAAANRQAASILGPIEPAGKTGRASRQASRREWAGRRGCRSRRSRHRCRSAAAGRRPLPRLPAAPRSGPCRRQPPRRAAFRPIRDHRDAAAARAYHEGADGQQGPDQGQLDELARLRRGHDAAPRSPVAAHYPAAFGGEGTRPGLVIVPDRLISRGWRTQDRPGRPWSGRAGTRPAWRVSRCAAPAPASSRSSPGSARRARPAGTTGRARDHLRFPAPARPPEGRCHA
jgi:hypothetical protein